MLDCLTPHALVIPCYQEEHRLPSTSIAALLQHPDVTLWLVDDGSRDGTRARLASLAAAHPGRVRVLALGENQGKGEAVRRGMLEALRAGAHTVGYADADFATPPAELLRLLDHLAASPELDAVMGCRVARLGADVRRSPARHLLGRVFASAASLALRSPVYDTQCGAKWFRATLAFGAALERPFSSRWAFDVELLGRLLGVFGEGPHLAAGRIHEEPLREWRHVPGSKVTLVAVAQSGADVLTMLFRSRRPRPHRHDSDASSSLNDSR